MTLIKPGAKAFFLPGNDKIALLFIHGFTASPSELYPTAQILHNSYNCTVDALLLPGHGTSPEEMNKTVWQDWFAAVEKELRLLLDTYEKVFVAGLSMGGMLALYAGIHIKDIRGIVSINAPIYLKYPVLRILAPFIQHYYSYVPKKSPGHLKSLKKEGRFAYDDVPIKAFLSMMEFRDTLVKELDKVNTPLLLMQSRLDESVNRKSAAYIYENVSSSRIKLIDLPDSRHVATMGIEKEGIAREIANFMDEN